MIRTSLIAAFALFGLANEAAADCQRLSFMEQGFTACTISATDDVRLFLHAPDGTVLGNFRTIDDRLASDGKKLAFAMNAGMYHPDRRPVGLYVEEGEQKARLVTSAGPGNFGMLPNGVFCIEQGRLTVTESRAFGDAPRNCTFATQSGPMLVIDGQYHPRFLRDSDSRLIRNGVGVSADGKRAWLVISDSPVSFYEFARFFRDGLGLPQALYLDGNVSRLHAPDLRRSDWGTLLGPIIGKVVDRAPATN